MATGSHRHEMGRRVLAESIELQHHVAADLAARPLPPVQVVRRRPVALDVLLVLSAILLLGVCGWFVV